MYGSLQDCAEQLQQPATQPNASQLEMINMKSNIGSTDLLMHTGGEMPVDGTKAAKGAGSDSQSRRVWSIFT